MARIQHVSLNNYRQGKFLPADVAIRIVDDESLFDKDQPDMIIHRLVFSDVDEAHPEAITALQARQILEILKKAHQCEHNVLVHCVAGVSRSAAVAQFAIDYLGFEDGNNRTDLRLPNSAVISSLKKALFGSACPFFQQKSG